MTHPTDALAQVASADTAQQEAHPFAQHVAEAAQRFGIPETWIWAVMRAESAGDPRAVSRVGAIGLMQIMPGTWAELRARYGLGRDPFDQRDNIMAGAAYLREMFDAYGSPGFLAAYNAGPDRYEQYLNRGRALPGETRNYVAQIAPQLGIATPPRMMASVRGARDWAHAALFIERSTNAPELQSDRTASVTNQQQPSTANALFVARAAPHR
jgi:soluble lytic murein transglycosylase-like protein